jgi:hypothetical protein
MIWLVFLPIGAVASIDRLRLRRKGQMTDVADSFCSPATAGLLLQVVLIYWGAVAARVGLPEWWSSFSAVHYLLHAYFATPLGRRFADFDTFTTVSTVGTLLLEGLGPPIALLCFRAPRVRTAIVVIFILFHFVLGRLMFLGVFEPICMISWLSFMPGQTWDALRWELRPADASAGAAPATSAQSAMGWAASKAASIIGSAVLIFVLAVNLVNDLPPRIAQHLGPLTRMPKLKQWWALMRRPEHNEYHLITEAELADGSTVTLEPKPTPDSSWELIFPSRDSRVGGQRRRTIIEIAPADRDRFIGPYCQWLQRQWDAAHGPDQQVRQIRVTIEVVVLPAFNVDEVLQGYPAQSSRAKVLLYTWPAGQSK